jgi:hypothetical protein
MNMARKAKIISIRIERVIDDSPDTSWLGEYANHPSSKYSIDREERGDRERGTYRYFNPSFNYVNDKDELQGITAAECRKYVEQDYKRMESLNAGDWSFLGIIAKAEVQLANSDTVQTIRSGGLWGIESDSDDAFLKEIEDQQLAELRSELLALGCTDKQIDASLKDIDRD